MAISHSYAVPALKVNSSSGRGSHRGCQVVEVPVRTACQCVVVQDGQ